MRNRDSLHQLVDSLPEGALASVERVLERFQIWPPEPPPDAKRMQERVEALLAERTAPTERHTEGLVGGSTSGGGRYRVGFGDDSDYWAHASGFKGETGVDIEIRRFRGHELQIERQLGFSRDTRKLSYVLAIKGPDGKEDRREIEFDVSESPNIPA
jgi:hypothetical protein